MRLSPAERDAIAAASHEAFPPGTRVLLFGSLLDDARRGGDIDLLVEPPRPLPPDELVERRTRFAARLYRLLEERRIDVVVTPGREPDPGSRSCSTTTPSNTFVSRRRRRAPAIRR